MVAVTLLASSTTSLKRLEMEGKCEKANRTNEKPNPRK